VTASPYQAQQSSSALPLFDPAAGELPPHSAIELYHEPPPVLSILRNIGMDSPAHSGWVEAVEAAWRASRDAAIASVRKEVEIKVGHHYERRGMASVGIYWPAHLRVTCVSHLSHPETEGFAQMHDHIYIGATAYPDNTPRPSMAGTPLAPLASDQADKPWPIDVYGLRHNAADMIEAMSTVAAQRELTARKGVRWTEIPGVRAPRTLPGFEEAAITYPRFICPGPERSVPDPPLVWPTFLEQAIAARGERMLEEELRDVERDARLRFSRLLEKERIVLRDVVYRREQDEDGNYLDIEDVLDELEYRGLYTGPPRDRVDQLDM
jgi:hypothetical protein